MKYKIVTLGCRTNQYESQAYRDQLERMGYFEASEQELAEICIVNTCTVTESADQRSRHQIQKIVRDHPGAKVFVTGCYSEREHNKVAAIPGVTEVVRNADKETLLEKAFPEQDLPEFNIEQFKAHTRAFVKVQDGCNSYCSYCVIPFVRGRSRSRGLDDVLAECRALIRSGYQEIVLTGINIGDYDGGDGSCRLHDLVKAVDQLDGLERLRISSIDPDEVDDDLLEAVVDGKRTCPSMHIVLQSGSNSTLTRMRRKYTKQDFFRACKRLKDARSDFTFTTDVIVGFPGESDADFQDTLDVIREIRFAKVHMFPYSKRPKTRASYFTDVIAPDVIQERKRLVLEEAERVAFDLREGYVGKRMHVLIESKDPLNLGYSQGHSENFLPITVPKKIASNTIVTVECVENTPAGLIGHEID